MGYGEDFLSAPVPTKRIEFDGGAWVEIRAIALAGDKEAIAASGRQGQSDVEFNIGRFQIQTLLRRIIAWSSPQPINRKNVEAMPEEMADRILVEIDALSQGRSDDEKKD